jgi:hypothetical protein
MVRSSTSRRKDLDAHAVEEPGVLDDTWTADSPVVEVVVSQTDVRHEDAGLTLMPFILSKW